MDDYSLQDLQLDTPFWDFSQALWQHEALRKALLAAQQQGASVNLLLFAAWCTHQQLHVENWLREHWELWQAWQQWHRHQSCAVRQQRMQLSRMAPCDQLYQRLLAAELEAERIEQALLYRCATHYGKTAMAREPLLQHNINTLLAQAGQNAATLNKQVRTLLLNAEQ